MTYSVTLEHGTDGSYLAWVHELPGCFVRGETRGDVDERLPAAIQHSTTGCGCWEFARPTSAHGTEIVAFPSSSRCHAG